MGEVVELPRRHVTVVTNSAVNVLSVDDIRSIAYGKTSISEFENPESMAQALAVIALEYVDE